MVAGKVAGGKQLAVVEIIIPLAAGLLGFAGERLLELHLPVLVEHLLTNASGVFFVAFFKKYQHGFAGWV